MDIEGSGALCHHRVPAGGLESRIGVPHHNGGIGRGDDGIGVRGERDARLREAQRGQRWRSFSSGAAGGEETYLTRICKRPYCYNAKPLDDSGWSSFTHGAPMTAVCGLVSEPLWFNQ